MRTNAGKEARTGSTNNDIYDSHFYTLAKRAFLSPNIQFTTLTISNIYSYDVSTCGQRRRFRHTVQQRESRLSLCQVPNVNPQEFDRSAETSAELHDGSSRVERKETPAILSSAEPTPPMNGLDSAPLAGAISHTKTNKRSVRDFTLSTLFWRGMSPHGLDLGTAHLEQELLISLSRGKTGDEQPRERCPVLYGIRFRMFIGN
jgi:hypothetical protein